MKHFKKINHPNKNWKLLQKIKKEKLFLTIRVAYTLHFKMFVIIFYEETIFSQIFPENVTKIKK